MSLSARDLWFILRAKDEAAGVLNSVSRDLLKVGTAAQVASARAQAASLRQRAQLMQSTGATKAQIAAVLQSADAWDKEAKRLEEAYQKQQLMARSLRDLSNLLALAGVALIGTGAAVIGALLSQVNYAAEYGKQVALTQTQVDGFSASLQQLGQIGKDTANNIAVPFEQVQPALYNIFSSTNANLAQATTLLNLFAQAAVAGATTIEGASKGTMAILNGFSLPLSKANDVLDIQFQLVRKGVGTYKDFNAVMGRIIPSANKAGQNFQTVAAMLAFMTRNGMSAATAATSGARALDAFSNPATVKKLQQMGIQFYDTTGKARPLADVMQALKDKIMALPGPERVAALTDVFKGSGGTIQAMRFINQIILQPGQMEAFLTFLHDMQNSTGQFKNAYAIMADTTANKTQLLKNRWDTLRTTIGETLTPAYNKLLDILGKVLGAFNDLSVEQQQFVIKATAWAGAFSIIAGGAFLAAAGVGYLASGLAAIGIELGPALIAIVAIGIAVAGLGAYFAKAYKDSQPFRDFIKDLGNTLSRYWTQDFEPFFKGLYDDYQKYMAPALHSMEDDFNNHVLPALRDFMDWFNNKRIGQIKEVFNAIRELGKEGFEALAWIYNNMLKPALDDLAATYEKHKKGIDQVIGYVMWLQKEFVKLGGMTVIGVLILAFLGIVGAVSLVIEGVSALINFISWVIHKISELVDWIKRGASEFSHFGDSINNAIGTAMNVIGGLPGRAKNAIGDLSNLLINAGKQIVQGLINGVQSMVPSLGGVLGALGSFITSHKGPPAKDRAMLYNAGQLIMDGLIRGIHDMRNDLGKELHDVSMSLQPSLAASTPNATVLASVRASSQAPATSRVVNNNLTVNQADRSPRQLATELGFELAGMA